MAYNEKLAGRIREMLPSLGIVEKRMMGGLTFMVNDKMCVCILKNDLFVRIDPSQYEQMSRLKHCRAMSHGGKPMKGYIFVSPGGTKTKKDLSNWINRALDFNKKAKVSKKKK